MSGNIVAEWLRSLNLGQYAESFLDNGYDDLEICKQVGEPDLDAIGVFNSSHRSKLLEAVRRLREEGAASVYFTLEEATAILHEECSSSTRCESAASNRGGSRGKNTNQASQRQAKSTCRTGIVSRGSPASTPGDSGSEIRRYLDEYEEGKIELVKIPRLQLQMLLKDKLALDGIRLSCLPYSTSNGEQGYLEGLASRYADEFSTHYQDVLEHLEDLRKKEWDDVTPIHPRPGRCAGSASPSTPESPRGLSGQSALTTSQSQPIYVPGKYLPSSCLSDREEDEIYDFGYGVYGKQMLARQQQNKLLLSPQGCLSPRSVHFYEFPPSVATSHTTGKKKLGISKLLKGFKTHRKDKGSPRHYSTNNDEKPSISDPIPFVGTPVGTLPPHWTTQDCHRLRPQPHDRLHETIQRLKVREAQLRREKFTKEHEEILRDIRKGLQQQNKNAAEGKQTAVFYTTGGDDNYMYDDDLCIYPSYPLPANVPAHWYDEPPYESDSEDFLDFLHNGREAFLTNFRGSHHKDEDVISLRTAGDISVRSSVAGGSNSAWPPTSTQYEGNEGTFFRHKGLPPPPESRSTDSLDQEQGQSHNPHSGAWYEQQHRHHRHHSPGGSSSSSSRRHHSSEPYTRLFNSPRQSLGSGDYGCWTAGSPSPAGGVVVGNTAGPSFLSAAKNCDYAASDVVSVGSRLSVVSIETNRSETAQDGEDSLRPMRKNGVLRKLRGYTSRASGGSLGGVSIGSEEGPSASQSSDYEDQEELEQRMERASGRGPGSLVGRMRGLRQDVQKRIFRLRRSSENPSSPPGATPSQSPTSCATPGINGVHNQEGTNQDTSSCNIPAPGSNRSSLSGEEPEQVYSGPFMGKARALVDCIPSPYDPDALRFKKGDIIDVIEMKPTGSWKGYVHNRLGNFKFINVEIIQDKPSKHKGSTKLYGRRKSSKRGRPKSVEELLQRIGLEEHISVFVLNGYEDLELFKDLEEADLDYLGISNSEHRVKLLTAVELLHDYDSSDTPETDDPPSSTDGSASQTEIVANRSCPNNSNFQRLQFPRDSGCYASNEDHSNRTDLQSGNSRINLEENTGDSECCNQIENRTQSVISQAESGVHSSEGYDIGNNLDLSSNCVATSCIRGERSEDVCLENGCPPVTHLCSNKMIHRDVLDRDLPAHFNIPVGLEGYRNKAQATIADFEAKFLRHQMNNRSLIIGKKNAVESSLDTHPTNETFTDTGGPRSLSSDSSGRAGSEKSSDSGISTSSRSPPSLPRHPKGTSVVVAQVEECGGAVFLRSAEQNSTSVSSISKCSKPAIPF